ncbi:response regulator [Persicimonas caeni]|nr:response regulator [Persicimonas caeni]
MTKPILIVEDEIDIRETLMSFLELKGYTVTTASNGREALKRLEEGLEPCLILLDLMMPTMDGWEFRTRQLADPDLADIPVLVLTGAHYTSEEAASLQALDVLSKPIDIGRMLDHVAGHVSS